jgi:MFS family permease
MDQESAGSTRGRWLALTAALLGWMFDGLEMGLFPLTARPALKDLLGIVATNGSDKHLISLWYDVVTAGFLVGAAAGGVLFGWLGDRIGRVRAMTLSVLCYALFSGFCAFSAAAWQMAVLRFISALGMGGEWALGVALVMEVWPNQSRAFLAGLIGAAGNVGYLLIAILGLGLSTFLSEVREWLLGAGLSSSWVDLLMANAGWRLLMIFGAVPALLTFFIRLLVPESEKWQREKSRGVTSHWAARDLGGVAIGVIGAGGMIFLRAADFPLYQQLLGAAAALVLVLVGYTYPVIRFLHRSGAAAHHSSHMFSPILRRMLLGACLGGVALLGTWASIQRAPLWADELSTLPEAKAYTQILSALGAIFGTMAGALIANWVGRRIAYSILCLASLASAWLFFRGNDHFGTGFLVSVFFAGGFSASFYGWLPLYLPELFPTAVRATGQGFSFNFGRVLAAIGVLQTSTLMSAFDNSLPKACSMMSLIYLVGIGLIWLAPETRGKPLPE